MSDIQMHCVTLGQAPGIGCNAGHVPELFRRRDLARRSGAILGGLSEVVRITDAPERAGSGPPEKPRGPHAGVFMVNQTAEVARYGSQFSRLLEY